MSIITTVSIEAKQTQAKVRISQGIDAAVMGLQAQMLSLFSRFWMNPELTPQQVSDAFGTDAAQLFVIMGKAQAFINDIKPNSFIQQPPKAFVINQDGTVTIS